MSRNRNGTILIIVAGVSALLASLALTFLVRMRSDVEESRSLVMYAQAKIMLAAACNYVQETSRLGWDRYWQITPNPPVPQVGGQKIHEEGYGWIDVRDGSIGPKNRNGDLLWYEPPPGSSGSMQWPSISTHVRCPMYRMTRPPFAIKLDTGYNLMDRKTGSPDYCYPLLRNPDPQPVIDNKFSKGAPTSTTDTDWNKFLGGDKNPIVSTMDRAWFRVYRDSPATFVVTCGAGPTQGFKDWNEVMSEMQTGLFGGLSGQPLFENLKATEIRLFYRIEWTAAAMETSYHNLHHEIATDTEHYETWPPNSAHTWSASRRTQTWAKNPVGTIRWIQRLTQEPTNW
jgi:hypothetical protein